MPQFRNSRRVRHSALEMYALVADVEKYPQFVPLCTGLRVRKRTTSPEGEVIVADMEVGYRAIREKFTSKVTCDAAKPAIHVAYIDGPFRRLVNEWRFGDGRIVRPGVPAVRRRVREARGCFVRHRHVVTTAR